MAKPVTDKGSLKCNHQGAVSLSSVSDGRLTVGGGKVVLFAKALPQPYAGCASPTPPGPCVSTVPAPPDSGRSSRLTVGRVPILLDSLAATSVPPGSPVTVSAGQSLLTAS